MAKTKRPKPSTPKPHHMAEPLDAPCVKCGYEWGRLAVVFDPDAAELETPFVCARCKHHVGKPA